MSNVSPQELLLTAARVMAEMDMCQGTSAQTSTGTHVPAEHGEVAAVSRSGAFQRAIWLLDASLEVADTAWQALTKHWVSEYGTGSPVEINDDLFPGDKELAVLEFKRVAGTV